MCQTLNYGYCIMNCSRECYKAKAEFWTSKTVLKPCLGKLLRNICWCSSQLRNALFKKVHCCSSLPPALRRGGTPQKLIIYFEGEDGHLKTQKRKAHLAWSSQELQIFYLSLCILQWSPSLITYWTLKLMTQCTMQKQYQKLWLCNGGNWTRTHPLRHCTTSICYCATRVVTLTLYVQYSWASLRDKCNCACSCSQLGRLSIQVPHWENSRAESRFRLTPSNEWFLSVLYVGNINQYLYSNY